MMDVRWKCRRRKRLSAKHSAAKGDGRNGSCDGHWSDSSRTDGLARQDSAGFDDAEPGGGDGGSVGNYMHALLHTPSRTFQIPSSRIYLLLLPLPVFLLASKVA